MKLLLLFGIIFAPIYGGVEADWWKTANFYQIYPRSFYDSDGDGVGDLNGITLKLSYLKEIGITATWLSPIFKSPMIDFGYDISNFTEIDPIFGTMEDFENLLKRAKELDIKIILDFVPNHTSDKCEWFKKSIAKESGYESFYVWHPGYEDPNNKTNRLPPSNWISQFRKSAWQWHNERKEFYLHQFVAAQPDLNYRNPKVHEAMKDVLEFWLKKGVAGFRIDAVPYIYEADPNKFEGKYPNEKINESVTDPEDYYHVIHDYTLDQPETLELLYEWRKMIDDFAKENGDEARVLMAETYSPFDIVMKYYGNSSVPGVHIPFNFLLIKDLNINSTAQEYATSINNWLSNMNDFRVSNWVLGNHDKNRVGSRMGPDRIDIMNFIIMVLPGIAVTYQGEEIGMTDVWISWDDTIDPWGCNSNPKLYEQFSRDPARTPFQWNDSINAGFSTAEKTWLPVGYNFNETNVKNEHGIERSHLNVYKGLRQLRNLEVFKKGAAKVLATGKNILAIQRVLDKEMYIVLTNIGNDKEVINIEEIFENIPNKLELTVLTDRSTYKKGDTVSSHGYVLLPKEAVVLKSIGKNSNGNNAQQQNRGSLYFIFLLFFLLVFCN